MERRILAGRAVGRIGLGCMNLSHAYGVPPAREVAEAVLRAALDLGVEHFDTAALYGFGKNEALLGEVLAPHRRAFFLASKCGMTGVNGKRVIDGRPATLKATCEESLKNLRTDHIDLYYLHRLDRTVAIEESVGALGELVRQGKIGAIGLSEVSAATLRTAHAVHPIAAVQNEYSLWSRNPEYGLLAACDELGVALVAFSQVARGFLAGGVRDTRFAPGDIRAGMPRFQGENFAQNLTILAEFEAYAAEIGVSPAQAALAWVLARGPGVHAIPGTTSVAHLREDMAEVALSPAQLARLEEIVAPRKVAGPRYPAATQAEIDTEEAPAA
ncbi:aldo/keto reductase [Acidocella sp.]|uniref:aldo/keto reductase n=1 Tax=Acidocella sp. TaxID=50710 RepID=UPI0026319EED|nr:aldo/keto reductase [Acidocella sp.]